MLLSPQGIFDLIMSLGYYPPFVVVQCMFQGNTAPRPSHIAGILKRGCRTSYIARASQNSTADKSNYSLIPRPSMPPVFECLQYAKMEGEGLGIFITWSMAWPSYVITPPFNSDARDRFYILCQLQRWDKRQQRAAPSVWNIPRLKATTQKSYQVTSIKIPSSDAIISWSERWHYLELYHSHPSAVKLRTQICFTGRTYLSYAYGTCFNSLTSL